MGVKVKGPMLAGVACMLLAVGLALFLAGTGVVALSGKRDRAKEASDFRTKLRERDGLREGRSVREEYVRQTERGMEVKEVR